MKRFFHRSVSKYNATVGTEAGFSLGIGGPEKPLPMEAAPATKRPMTELTLEALRAELAPIRDEQAAIPAELARIHARLDAIDARLGAIDGRLGAIDARLGAIDGRLGAIDARLGAIEPLAAGIPLLHRAIEQLRHESRQIRVAVNDISAVQMTAGEAEALHTDVDKTMTRQDQIEARLATVERLVEELRTSR